MYIKEVSASEYKSCFIKYPHIYNTTEFSELNRHKVENIRYLLFEDTKTRFGIILGETEKAFHSPFSAPFGSFTSNKRERLEYLNIAVTMLKEYGNKNKKKIIITLPPTIYDSFQISRTVNIMSRMATLRHADINYHFDLCNFNIYNKIAERNARKNLNRAMREDLKFRHIAVHDKGGISKVYNIIRQNREEHGYPLRMSLDDVMKTIEVIPADFFILEHKDTGVASAQVFQTTEDIFQVIYWGNSGIYSDMRPMNRLAYHIFEYYNKKGARILDIGPSTENGEPNYGLCDFKESIGCSATPKFSFEL